MWVILKERSVDEQLFSCYHCCCCHCCCCCNFDCCPSPYCCVRWVIRWSIDELFQMIYHSLSLSVTKIWNPTFREFSVHMWGFENVICSRSILTLSLSLWHQNIKLNFQRNLWKLKLSVIVLLTWWRVWKESMSMKRWSATDAVCQMICHSCSVGRGSIQPFCVFNNPTFSGLSETWNFRTFGDQVWCLALVRNWKICWFLINSQEVCPFLAYSPNCIVHVGISFCQFSATFLIYIVLQFWSSKTMKNKEIPFILWENSDICIEFFQKQAKSTYFEFQSLVLSTLLQNWVNLLCLILSENARTCKDLQGLAKGLFSETRLLSEVLL